MHRRGPPATTGRPLGLGKEVAYWECVRTTNQGAFWSELSCAARRERRLPMKLSYTTKDIVTIVVVAVISGLIGAGWGFVWNLAFAVPTIGGILSAAITFIWFIAPLVTFYLIRKPGVALFTQL